MSRRSETKLVEHDDYGSDLVASGSSGPWQVFVDEAHTGPDRWFAQIRGPSVYFSFEILSPHMIDRLHQFLEHPSAAPSNHLASRSDKNKDSLRLGKESRCPITFLRDNEYTDRCFLVVGSVGKPVVRYSLEGTDLAKLTEAVRQVREELKNEGLLS